MYKDKETERKAHAKYRATHKEERKASGAAYYAKNRERIRNKHKAHYWNGGGKEAHAAYYAANREKVIKRSQAAWAAMSPIERARHDDRAYRRKIERRLERMEKEMQSWHKDT